ncbi:hypothetical protein B0A54_07126 [Friedmanniomyces endolithicus]|uniref:MJ1316 RNA cyclic group end recognition domain-containing protein n=1 Tax=Friedmanniomyces endolithicus TaxID=329885 RepID=A0A4U0V2N4_9PEZI|nr:hypothetical protein LTS09_007260 [Friedmanniomyces endolithicus]TKA42910.1 hypothetical protein B0A54_07126 [Friedmanniomyces endolithicus]
MAPPTAPDVDQTSMLANIHTLSLVLHAHYIDFLDADWSTSAPRNMHPQRYLFPTSTLAADLWEPGEDIHLVCMTEDRKTTFWAIVTSELQLEGERGWTLTDGTMALDWSLLGLSGCRAAKLAGSALYLHYALLPPQFSLDLLPTYGIPEYRRKDTVAYMPKHVDLVRHALHLTTALQTPPFSTFPFLPTYRRLRRWAYALGLLGPKLGLLDGKTLLNLVFGACSGYLHHPTTTFPSSTNFLETFFLQSTSWLPAYSSALGANPHGQRALVAALKWTCERLIAKGGPGGSSLATLALDRISPAQGFQSFLSSYEYFLVLHAETWGSAESTWRFIHHRFEGLVQRLVLRLHEGDGEGRKGTARAWSFLVMSRTDRVACVIGMERRLEAEEVRELTIWLREGYDGVDEEAAVVLRRQLKREVALFGEVIEEAWKAEEVRQRAVGGGNGVASAETVVVGAPKVEGKRCVRAKPAPTVAPPVAGSSSVAAEPKAGEGSETETPAKHKKKKKKKSSKKKPPNDGPSRAGDLESSGPSASRAPTGQGPTPGDAIGEEYRNLIQRRDSIPGLNLSQSTNTTDLPLTNLALNDSTDESPAPIPTHLKRKKRSKNQLSKAQATPTPIIPSTPSQPEPAPAPPPTPLLSLPRILARLRWHPDHRGIRYEIGYRDRFLPELQWMPMEEWGRKATEEEDWIPGHRVMVIRAVGTREGEGEGGGEGVVWDRGGRGNNSS